MPAIALKVAPATQVRSRTARTPADGPGMLTAAPGPDRTAHHRTQCPRPPRIRPAAIQALALSLLVRRRSFHHHACER